MSKAKDIVASWGQRDIYGSLSTIERVELFDSLKLDQTNKITRTELFKAGSYPNTKHGIFNPSCVQRGSKLEVIFRCESSEATWAGYMLTDKATPQVSVGEITKDGLSLSAPRPIFSGTTLSCRPEDWRLFLHKGKTFTNFTNYFYLNRGWPQKKVQCRVGVGVVLNNRIQFLRESSHGRTELKIRQEEKNWAFFSNKDQMHCIYSIEPWVVLKTDDTGFPIDMQKTETRFPRLGWRYLACSTNPIKISLPKWGNVWFMFCHQFLTPKGKGSRNRTYYQHAIIFNDNHKPIAWTPNPIIGGGDHIGGRHNGVVYISGVVDYEENIFALSGEGDSYSAMYRIEKKTLSENLHAL